MRFSSKTKNQNTWKKPLQIIDKSSITHILKTAKARRQLPSLSPYFHYGKFDRHLKRLLAYHEVGT